MEFPSGYLETDVDIRGVVKTGRSTTMTFAYDQVYQDDVPRWDQVAQRGYSRYAFDPQVRQFAFALDESRAASWVSGLTVTTAWVRSRERRERQRVGSSVSTTEQDVVNTYAVTAEARSTPLPGLTIVAGAELYDDRVDSWRVDSNVAAGTSVSMRGLFPDDAGALFAAGFGLASYRRGRFGADFGARYTWTRVAAEDPLFGNVDVSPGAWVGSGALTCELAEGIGTYGSVSAGVPRPESRRPQHARAVRLRRRGSGRAPRAGTFVDHGGRDEAALLSRRCGAGGLPHRPVGLD